MLDRDFFFSFEGRAPRWEYWLFIAMNFGYGVLVQILVMPLFGTRLPEHPVLFQWLFLVLTLPLLWPALAISVRRLHDRNKGNEWAWLFLGTPIVVFAILLLILFVTTAANIHSRLLYYFLLAIEAVVLGISLWGFIELAILRGTRGDNRFGPDPLPAVVKLPSGEKVYRGLPPGGHSVRLTIGLADGCTQNEYYYVAESDPQRARTVLRDAKGARDEDVKTIDTILHETVERLHLKPGEFAPVPRAR